LGNGDAYEKTHQNSDGYESKSELVTGTNLLRPTSHSYKCRYLAPATRSHTHHYMAEAYRKGTAVLHIRNCRYIRWLYPT